MPKSTIKPQAGKTQTTTQTPVAVPALRVHEYGHAIVPKLAEVEPLPHEWGAVAGMSYFLEALNAIEHNEREGYMPHEFVSEMLTEASEIVRNTVPILNGLTRVATAREVIFIISELAAMAISSGVARTHIEKERAALVTQIELDDEAEHRRLKAKAMLRRVK